MTGWSALILAIVAVVACVQTARASERGPAVPHADSKQAAFTVFVRRMPVVQDSRAVSLRRTDFSGPAQPVATTEVGARLRLTEHSTAYLKVLKFRATVSQATRGVQASSQTMIDRPRLKAITAGIKFAF